MLKGLEIIADFEQDAKDFIKDNILDISNNSKAKNLKKEFNVGKDYWDKPLSEILRDYYNFLDRIIHPVPRSVVLTSNIKNNVYYKNQEKKLFEIKKKFELGLSVNAYLSTLYNKNYKHKDTIYHLFGMHHLHLGAKLENSKIERSDYLLLIQVDDDKNVVYFLDVETHDEFNKNKRDYPKYLNILEKEDLLNSKYIYHVNDTIEMGQEYSVEEYRDIYNNGLISFMQTKKGVVFLRPRNNFGLLDAIWYSHKVLETIDSYKRKYLNIISVHDLLSKSDKSATNITKCQIKLLFKDLNLLHNISVNLKTDGEIK